MPRDPSPRFLFLPSQTTNIIRAILVILLTSSSLLRVASLSPPSAIVSSQHRSSFSLLGKRSRTLPTNTGKAMTTKTLSSLPKLVTGKLDPSRTIFFLCDIQERFRPLMYHSETVIRTAKYLTSVADALSIPVLGTEQYPKVFGPLVSDCFSDGISPTAVFAKKKFSMLTDEVTAYLEKDESDMKGRDSVVLFGIEAHVCVQQTCLELLSQEGKEVHIIADGVSSQQPYDRDIALQRMANAGAFITTAQSAAFMLMQSAEHEHFKTVSKLTVEHMKLTNEFNDDYTKNVK